MGQGPLFDVVVMAGAALLAWRLRREHHSSAATFLFLPAVMLAFILARRELVIGAAGTLGAPAALAGVLAGLVVATRSFVRVELTTGSIVVRATATSLLLWPGTLAIYVLGRRAALWLRGGEAIERLDGVFLVFVVALVLAERGWLYHAYRHAAAPAKPRRP